MSTPTEAVTVSANRSYAPDRYLFSDDAGGEIQLLGSRSDETGSLFWPRRLRCPRTGGTVSDVHLATEGVLWSWTFVAAPWPGEAPPNDGGVGYGVGLVDVDGAGPRVVAPLVGVRDTWQVGERMRARELHYLTIDGTPRSILAFEAIAEVGA
jgi:uncharacterized OB-fold protein